MSLVLCTNKQFAATKEKQIHRYYRHILLYHIHGSVTVV